MIRKISWSDGLRKKANRNEKIDIKKENVVIASYRPFCKQFLYYDEKVLERPSKMKDMFKNKNKLICVCGKKGFTSLMVDTYVDLHFVGDSQCFPLYWYEETSEVDLFNINDEKKIVRHDGISDYIFKQCINKYKTNEISKEDIFYYVYGLLHSKDYRSEYESDLKKSYRDYF